MSRRRSILQRHINVNKTAAQINHSAPLPKQQKVFSPKEEKESAGRALCSERETVWGSNSLWALKNALLCLYTHSLALSLALSFTHMMPKSAFQF